MEKILTISIAAYNVEGYIKNALNSLLVENIEDLEILVEDDGGTDNTANIVKEYEKKYPNIVKLVHKENGGYGSTINKSIELARGKYFKQLDGDDWYDSKNFVDFLELLRKIDADMVYTPFYQFKEKGNIYELKDILNKELNGECSVRDLFSKSNNYLNMYTICYKTDILKVGNLKLLEKCFYTDTQYAMYPVVNANTIYISHNPIYIYRIGRNEQSVSLVGRIKHYEDHVKVSKDLLEFYNDNLNVDISKQRYLLNYIINHVSNTISGYYIILESNKENLKQIIEFEKYILDKNKTVYDKMEEQSKIVKILRKTNYNYVIYKILSKLKIRKMKKSHK